MWDIRFQCSVSRQDLEGGVSALIFRVFLFCIDRRAANNVKCSSVTYWIFEVSATSQTHEFTMTGTGSRSTSWGDLHLDNV